MIQMQTAIALPEPSTTGSVALERLLQQRRSIREYRSNSVVALGHIGQLLWAAQGISNALGLRTAPSAGALYPLELYVAASNVQAVEQGIYHYQPENHQLDPILRGDFAKALARAAYGQSSVQTAAAVIVICSVPERTTRKYGQRGMQYIHIEAGHAAENLFLQVEALGLATVVVGAFYDDEVVSTLQLPLNEIPLLLMPIGCR